MSRGPGKLQEQILAAVEEAAGTALTVETLRWALYEASGMPELSTGGKLPTAWDTSFRRAIKGLVDRDLLAIDPRPLESFAECVEHYPGKTLKVDARNLRKSFLPVLLEWSDEKHGLGPKYGEAANEEHHFRMLSRERVSELQAEWLLLEERLRTLYGAANSAPSDNLLMLICRGRYLFGTPGVSASGSLSTWIRAVCKDDQVSDLLATDLHDFLENFIPAGTAGALKLKSVIHSLAEVARHGPCRLRKDTLEHLYERQKSTVEAMPGFKKKKGRFSTILNRTPIEFDYDSELKKLIDHTVFQDFSFVALNQV